MKYKNVKVLIDAGHYGTINPYKVLLPDIRYSEAEMAWALQGYLKPAIEAYGIEVGVTRTDPNKDVDVVTRGKMAKGYDLLLSNHSNACNTESVNRAVMCCYQDVDWTEIDDISVEVGKVLGKTVKDVMGLPSYQIYQRKAESDRDRNGVRDDEYYGILYGARLVGTPAVIVEHSFHTNKAAAKWLTSSENLKVLAKAQAAAIAKYFGVGGFRGDVNGDGEINSLDASLVLKYDAGLTSLTEEQKKAADYNQDGEVNSLDASAMLKHDAGL